MSYVRDEIQRTISTFQAFLENESLVRAVSEVGQVCGTALENGNKILLVGNGGSAADCQHIAAEFISRLSVDRCPLPAIALTTDTSILTSSANDYGYETVFERQILALGRQGDILIAISTSGNSPNVLRAVKAARAQGLVTVGLTGSGGGKVGRFVDYLIDVPSTRTQNVQELHIMIGHTICAIAEQSFLMSGRRVPDAVGETI